MATLVEIDIGTIHLIIAPLWRKPVRKMNTLISNLKLILWFGQRYKQFFFSPSYYLKFIFCYSILWFGYVNWNLYLVITFYDYVLEIYTMLVSQLIVMLLEKFSFTTPILWLHYLKFLYFVLSFYDYFIWNLYIVTLLEICT